MRTLLSAILVMVSLCSALVQGQDPPTQLPDMKPLFLTIPAGKVHSLQMDTVAGSEASVVVFPCQGEISWNITDTEGKVLHRHVTPVLRGMPTDMVRFRQRMRRQAAWGSVQNQEQQQPQQPTEAVLGDAQNTADPLGGGLFGGPFGADPVENKDPFAEPEAEPTDTPINEFPGTTDAAPHLEVYTAGLGQQVGSSVSIFREEQMAAQTLTVQIHNPTMEDATFQIVGTSEYSRLPFPELPVNNQVQVEGVRPTEIMVSWQPTVQHVGDAPNAIEYCAEYRPLSSILPGDVITSPCANQRRKPTTRRLCTELTSLSLTGLQPNTEYVIDIIATNVQSTGALPYSSARVHTSKDGLPVANHEKVSNLETPGHSSSIYTFNTVPLRETTGPVSVTLFPCEGRIRWTLKRDGQILAQYQPQYDVDLDDQEQDSVDSVSASSEEEEEEDNDVEVVARHRRRRQATVGNGGRTVFQYENPAAPPGFYEISVNNTENATSKYSVFATVKPEAAPFPSLPPNPNVAVKEVANNQVTVDFTPSPTENTTYCISAIPRTRLRMQSFVRNSPCSETARHTINGGLNPTPGAGGAGGIGGVGGGGIGGVGGGGIGGGVGAGGIGGGGGAGGIGGGGGGGGAAADIPAYNGVGGVDFGNAGGFGTGAGAGNGLSGFTPGAGSAGNAFGSVQTGQPSGNAGQGGAGQGGAGQGGAGQGGAGQGGALQGGAGQGGAGMGAGQVSAGQGGAGQGGAGLGAELGGAGQGGAEQGGAGIGAGQGGAGQGAASFNAGQGAAGINGGQAGNGFNAGGAGVNAGQGGAGGFGPAQGTNNFNAAQNGGTAPVEVTPEMPAAPGTGGTSQTSSPGTAAGTPGLNVGQAPQQGQKGNSPGAVGGFGPGGGNPANAFGLGGNVNSGGKPGLAGGAAGGPSNVGSVGGGGAGAGPGGVPGGNGGFGANDPLGLGPGFATNNNPGLSKPGLNLDPNQVMSSFQPVPNPATGPNGVPPPAFGNVPVPAGEVPPPQQPGGNFNNAPHSAEVANGFGQTPDRTGFGLSPPAPPAVIDGFPALPGPGLGGPPGPMMIETPDILLAPPIPPQCGTATRHTIKNVTAGIPYEIQVFAVNPVTLQAMAYTGAVVLPASSAAMTLVASFTSLILSLALTLALIR